MNPSIIQLQSKTLIGVHQTMSLIDNKTGELWKSFRPRVKEISNRVSTDFYSLQIYDSSYFNEFNPAKDFIKWAGVEVNKTDSIPTEMAELLIPSGLYAVFHYVGNQKNASNFFSEIFNDWLPKSEYHLDNRPHFEILGSKYKNGDTKSEEDVWIPIRLKSH